MAKVRLRYYALVAVTTTILTWLSQGRAEAGDSGAKNAYEIKCPGCGADLARHQPHGKDCPLNPDKMAPQDPELAKRALQDAERRRKEELERSLRQREQELEGERIATDAERAAERRQFKKMQEQQLRESQWRAISEMYRTAADVNERATAAINQWEKERQLEEESASAKEKIMWRYGLSSWDDAQQQLKNQDTKVKIAVRATEVLEDTGYPFNLTSGAIIGFGAAAAFNNYVAKPTHDFIIDVGKEIDEAFAEAFRQTSTGRGTGNGTSTGARPTAARKMESDTWGYFNEFFKIRAVPTSTDTSEYERRKDRFDTRPAKDLYK